MDGFTASEPDQGAKTQSCDVMVIGGGPGGAATAALLARAGVDVVLVEKDSHPRFHIGESLLPGSLPLLDDLGVLEAVKEIGIFKPGAEFISEDGKSEAVFEFSRALLDWPDHAYQVRRSEFDQILFERAVTFGVKAYQGTTATIRGLDDDGAIVETQSAAGDKVRWRTRFLIDASGRSTLVSKMLDQKRPDPKNSSAAIFGHFRGVPRKAGTRGGNIRIYLTRPGWMWQIPLRNDITSVGWVATGPHLAGRDCGIDEFFNAHCARHPHLAELMAGTERVEAMHATGNFSYRATVASGACHIKVGDAYGFIDPIFSSGVHLALISAADAARRVMTILAHPARRLAELDAYHRKIEKRLSFVSWFIYQIHDPVFRQMMVNPKDILGIERALISLLAADFRPDPRLRTRIALFKLIRYMVKLTTPAREIGHVG